VQRLTLSTVAGALLVLSGCFGTSIKISKPDHQAHLQPLRVQLSQTFVRARAFAADPKATYSVSEERHKWVDEYLIKNGDILHLMTEKGKVEGVFSGPSPGLDTGIILNMEPSMKIIALQSIRRIRVIKKSTIGPFLLGGLLFGSAAGLFITHGNTHGSSGLAHPMLFSIGGLAVGTLMGLLSGLDVEFEIPPQNDWIRLSTGR
jgi:hypothetical protein